MKITLFDFKDFFHCPLESVPEKDCINTEHKCVSGRLSCFAEFTVHTLKYVETCDSRHFFIGLSESEKRK